MIGQKPILFYEVPLPHPLPQNVSWLLDYRKNSKQLIHYLESKGAEGTRYLQTIHCLSDLQDYLLANNLPYTESNASSWCDSLEFPKPRGSALTLARLSDIYHYGKVQPLNVFPQWRSYAKLLDEPWDNLLQEYLDAGEFHGKHCHRVKQHVSKFLFWLQTKDINNPSEITYNLLDKYFKYDKHNTRKEKSRYTLAVGNFITFLADKGLCNHTIGWYPYYWRFNLTVRKCNLSKAQQSILTSLKEDSPSFSIESMFASSEVFLDEYKKSGYDKRLCLRATYTIRNLFLFLDMYGVGYKSEAVEIWLDHEMSVRKKSEWLESRRILHLFDNYLKENTLNPQIRFTPRNRLYDNIPVWCKAETDEFLSLKKKNGYAQRTIDGASTRLAHFCTYLDNHNISCFSDISPKILTDFNLSEDICFSDKSHYIGTSRQFLQHLERKGILPYGRHLALSSTAASHERIITILTKDEKEAIAEKHLNCNAPIELRDKAMLLLGMKMGLRGSDVVNILLTDIDWEKQTIRILQQKTQHEILLPMPVSVGNAIYNYIKNGRPNSKTLSDRIFVKAIMPYDSVTSNVCIDALERTLPRRNVPQSGFHVTRKTYATDRLRSGVIPQGIADLLGHKDTHSLSTYLQYDEENMRLCPISLSESGLTMKGERYDKV